MTTTINVAKCVSGSKTPFATDPCPSGQRFETETITFANQADYNYFTQQISANSNFSEIMSSLDTSQLTAAFFLPFSVVITMYIIGVIVSHVTQIIKRA